MGFLSKTKALATALIGNDENINEDNLTDKEIEEIIMSDANANELLKVLSNRRKAEDVVKAHVNKANKIKEDLSSVRNALNSNSQAAMRKYYDKMKKEKSEKENTEKEIGD